MGWLECFNVCDKLCYVIIFVVYPRLSGRYSCGTCGSARSGWSELSYSDLERFREVILSNSE